MKIYKAYKYELKPNKQQRNLLDRHAGAARKVYNWGLEQCEKLLKEFPKGDIRRYTNSIKLHKELVQLKKTEFAWHWLNEISSHVPHETLKHLDAAFKRLREGVSKFPRWKKKFRQRDDNFSFLNISQQKQHDKRVTLPKIGIIRTKHPLVQFRSEKGKKPVGRILSATVSRQADRWFVSFAVECEIPDPIPVDGPVVGVDLGISSFATISDKEGNYEKIPNNRPLRKALKKLRKLNKQHSRKQKDSNNGRKSALKLARLHRRIKNKRLDPIHKLTTRLAKTKSIIVIEDLKKSNMIRNRKLSRALSDVSFGEFRRQLTYKCHWYGSKLAVADKFFPSSKKCSSCGFKKDLSLSDRTYECSSCSYKEDRDVNAAINLAKLV